MGHIAVSSNVIARDSFGQFISRLEAARHATMADVAQEGEGVAKRLAPAGHKVDPRTPRIQDSMFHESDGTSARWGSRARHALAQEKGGRPHRITGDPLHFYWEKEGRFFRGPRVNHPGNPAHPYLVPSYKIMMRRWMEIAKRHYPR